MVEFEVFADGACSGNPGRGGWGLVLWEQARGGGSGKVIEMGGASANTTNNRMELTAILQALKWILEVRKAMVPRISFFTDSQYVIRGAQEWLKGWKARNWETSVGHEVKNKDIWQAVDQGLLDVESCGGSVVWTHVRGHRGIIGNERADQIAVAFSQQQKISLYDGAAAGYPIPLEAQQDWVAPYYVSWVDGEIQRHDCWEECHRRVRGVSQAKYRKICNPMEERDWLAKIKK